MDLDCQFIDHLICNTSFWCKEISGCEQFGVSVSLPLSYENVQIEGLIGSGVQWSFLKSPRPFTQTGGNERDING